MVQAISWNGTDLVLIDQTHLPDDLHYRHITTVDGTFEAIQRLRVRGAPAIGITAAYGLYLAVRNDTFASPDDFFGALRRHIDYLSGARPTAVNLVWALEAIYARLTAEHADDVETLKKRLLDAAIALHDDDRRRCEAIGAAGAELVAPGAGILTHCNTGALATGGIGTAFGVIYHAHRNGKGIHVYADETRPVLQGARLTMFELEQAEIPATLICDNMAAALMQAGRVDMVVVGADRIAANGSAANKIGTYGVAVLARHHGIPFYVAAPLSTIDRRTATGADIPIENRDPEEVRSVFERCTITIPGADVWNPAFDVTPPELIDGIITEVGVLRAPYSDSIEQAFSELSSHNQ